MMWLLNTSNLKLEEFYGDIPKYGIAFLFLFYDEANSDS